MAILRSTVIMKTDLYEFTLRTRTLSEAELSVLLSQQKALVSDVAIKNEGSIVKGEGDSFWLIFPSVTVAALAAVELQQELRAMQSGLSDEKRLAIRVAITLGDVLHQDNDIFGEVVNLTARIESITPKDEIYLSQSAWLALNQNAVQSSYVNDFTLKGISEPVRIYRIEQKHKTRVIKNQVICYTDIGKFTQYYATHPLDASENLLLFLDDVIKSVCEKYDGEIRIILADGHILTFPEPKNALSAMTELCLAWINHTQAHEIPCGLNIGIHQGDINIFRSHLYGDDVNRTIMYAGIRPPQLGKVSVLTSEKFFQSVQATEWQNKLIRLEEDRYYLVF